MEFVLKIKEWFSKSGFENVFILIYTIAVYMLVSSDFLLGGGIGAFVALNWAVIKELWREGIAKVDKELNPVDKEEV